MSTVTTTAGGIAAYCTDAAGNRCGYIFDRFPYYHVVLWDDRWGDEDINNRYETLEEAEFAAFLRQHNFDQLDAMINDLSKVEAAKRAQDVAEWWDEMLHFDD